MANVDNAFGLRPLRRNGASYVTGGGNVYSVPAGFATSIAPGDPVIKISAGAINGVPSVHLATAASVITGVCLGIANSPDPTLEASAEGSVTFDTALNTVASATFDQYILVEDDPQVTYAIQNDGVLTDSLIGLNANMVVATPAVGKSRFELDTSSAVTNASFPLKILRLVQLPDNEVGEFAVVEVFINTSTQANDTAGI